MIPAKRMAELLYEKHKDCARSLNLDEKWICCILCQSIIEESSLSEGVVTPFTEYWKNVQLEIQKL